MRVHAQCEHMQHAKSGESPQGFLSLLCSSLNEVLAAMAFLLLRCRWKGDHNGGSPLDEDDKDEDEGSKHQGVTGFSLGVALEVGLQEPSSRAAMEGFLGAEILTLPMMTLMLRIHMNAW